MAVHLFWEQDHACSIHAIPTKLFRPFGSEDMKVLNIRSGECNHPYTQEEGWEFTDIEAYSSERLLKECKELENKGWTIYIFGANWSAKPKAYLIRKLGPVA